MTCRLALTIRSHEGFFLEGSWFLFISIITAKTEEFCISGTGSQMRRGPSIVEYPLFGSFLSLSFLALFLRLFASTLLNTFLLRGDPWDNIIKWIVDDPDRLDLWGAIVGFQDSRAPCAAGLTY